jgi:hypothetical protein
LGSGSGIVGGLSISAGKALAVFEPEAVAVHLEELNVAGETVEASFGLIFTRLYAPETKSLVSCRIDRVRLSKNPAPNRILPNCAEDGG